MKSPTKLAAVVCVLLLAAGLCAAEDAAVESQDAVVETQDATIEPQDATIEPQDAVVETRDATIEPQDAVVETEDVADESEDVADELDVLDETEYVADKSPLTPTDDTAPTVQETSKDDAQLEEDSEVLQDAGKDALISEAGASAEASPTQDSEDAVDPSSPVTTPPPPSDAEAGEVPDVDSTPATATPPPEPAWNRSAPDWFRRGVDAYLSEHWEECTRSLENAIVEWHFFRRANIDCRVRCGEEARRAAPLYAADVEHLHFVEEMVRATLCILKCKRRAFRGHATPDALPSAVQKTFRDLKAYEYLQLCYYQTQQTQKAASAVFTILSHDPNNEIMKHNLKYYLAKPGIDVNSIVNYESEKFVSLYTLGTEAYFKEEYDAAISNLEASLKEFFKASDECRADCEGPFDQGWLPDFTSSIANHFVYCLKCKAKCQSKLSVLNGEKYDDFLATHFNYLQFAYYKKGNLREACAAAGTYLLFLPGDSTMLENVEYYKTLPKVDDSMFRPRADAEKYIKRQSYEESLLTYISDEFVFEENEDTNEIPHAEEIYKDRGGDVIIKNGTPQSLPWATAHKTLTKIHLEPVNLNQDIAHKSSMLEEKRLMLGKNQKVEGNSAENKIEKKSELNSSFEQLMNQLRRMTDRPIYNLRKEDELGGIRRFVIDGLAEENECERLIQFAKASGVSGDGYGGNKSPHSSQENFEGVTLGRAALMMNFGLIERSVLHLFLSLSERGRNMIAAYFNIPNKNLYFSYTHLVCRSAKPGEFFNSSQYSHEIHADNCWLSKNGDCMKADPAYYWRDYSALIYLNNNFKGGEFLFSADAYGNHIQSTIQPKCGRLVGFSSGIENLHGVRGVEQGSRCALALWFTLDSQRAEWGRALTEEVVHDIENGKKPEPEILHNLQKLVRFDLAQAQSQLLYKSSEQDGSMSDTHQDNFTVR